MEDSTPLGRPQNQFNLNSLFESAYWAFRFLASTGRQGSGSVSDEVAALGRRANELLQAAVVQGLAAVTSDAPPVGATSASVASAVADLAGRLTDLESACVDCAFACARAGNASDALALFNHVTLGRDDSPWERERRSLSLQIALHTDPAESVVVRASRLVDWLCECGPDHQAEETLAEFVGEMLAAGLAKQVWGLATRLKSAPRDDLISLTRSVGVAAALSNEGNEKLPALLRTRAEFGSESFVDAAIENETLARIETDSFRLCKDLQRWRQEGLAVGDVIKTVRRSVAEYPKQCTIAMSDGLTQGAVFDHVAVFFQWGRPRLEIFCLRPAEELNSLERQRGYELSYWTGSTPSYFPRGSGAELVISVYDQIIPSARGGTPPDLNQFFSLDCHAR